MKHEPVPQGERAALHALNRVGAAYLDGSVLVPTTDGLRSAAALTPAQSLVGSDGSTARVLRVQKRAVTPTFPAILLRINAGVLGAETVVRVSHGIPILIDHWVCAPLFGIAEALAYAGDFSHAPGVEVDILKEGEIVELDLDRSTLVTVGGLRICLEGSLTLRDERPPLPVPLLDAHETYLLGTLPRVMRWSGPKG